MESTSFIKVWSRTLASTLAITAIGFFTSVLTARGLGAEGRGLLSAALLIATLASSVSQLGLGNSYVYHAGARCQLNFKKLLTISLCLVGLLAPLMAVGALQFSTDIRLHQDVVLIMAMACAAGLQNYLSTLSQVQPDLSQFNKMRMMLALGNLLMLSGLFLANSHLNYINVMAGQILVSGLLAVYALIWIVRNIDTQAQSNDGGRKDWKEIVNYSLSYHGTVLLGIILLNFDKIALMKLGSVVEFGFYAMAFSTSRLIGTVQEAVSTSLYSRHAGRNVAELAASVEKAFRLTFLPMILLSTLITILAPYLILLVFGHEFSSMTVSFSILIFECVIGGASWTLAQRFNAGGRPGLVLARQALSVLPLIIALPFLPSENAHIYLSSLMFLGALLRLMATMILYPFVLHEPIPAIFPRCEDIAFMRSQLTKLLTPLAK